MGVQRTKMSQQSRGAGRYMRRSCCTAMAIFLVLCSVVVHLPAAAASDRPSDVTWMRRMADGVKDAVASTPHLRQVQDLRQEKPAGGQNCTTNATCHHGTCVKEANATADDSGFCVCTPGWMGETCQYEQKSLKTAFLLSFLLGNIGADRLYLGYVGSGVAKLLINLFLCMLPCCPLC